MKYNPKSDSSNKPTIRVIALILVSMQVLEVGGS
jgi:hypothetical protein